MERICLITETGGYGGSEIHTSTLVRFLNARGIAVELISCRNDVYDDLLPADGMATLTKTSLSTGCCEADELRRWRGLLEGVGCRTVLLVKGWWKMGSLPFLRELRQSFERVVFVEHALPEPMPPRSSRRFLGVIPGLGLWWYRMRRQRGLRYRYPDLVVAVSGAVAGQLTGNGYCPPEKVRVVTNGIDCRRYRHDAVQRKLLRERYGVGEGQTLFGMVTRFDEMKGVDLAIEAFHRVSRETDALLLLVGSGKLEESLKEMVRELGLSGRVIFAGQQREVWPFYSAFDIFVMPSINEAIGLSLLEAMAAECLPVVSSAGEMPSVVEGIGQVVEVEALREELPAAMIEASRLDAAVKEERRRLAKERVFERYNMEHSYAAFASLIASL
ncbi:glycosyltransferase family 4 protein [Geomonas sp. Red32]|uniref:glycosyltransferase family 4 protein n=1 Tax=Geomonas sp. Red32 TaxID=2912856 RepID=UPI00202CCA68|nr:glycosyltransferase family 4 protein [Geomonas sp. Red32]MCM0083361.1 glycosyltransferase family 4 protein [Geomonas sp. Red32]